jgi:hypothetical protein
MLDIRDKRNREDLLNEFRLLMAQNFSDRSSTASTSTPHSARSTSTQSISGSSGSQLTKEKILDLIMPLLPSGQCAFYYYTFLFIDPSQDTHRSSQPTPGTEDIEMEAPPANAAEVAATLFAELQRQVTNGKHINYISRHFKLIS